MTTWKNEEGYETRTGHGEDELPASPVERGVKPKYRLCWLCNRQFRGNHFTVRTIDGHIRHIHKTCAEDHDKDLCY